MKLELGCFSCQLAEHLAAFVFSCDSCFDLFRQVIYHVHKLCLMNRTNVVVLVT